MPMMNKPVVALVIAVALAGSAFSGRVIAAPITITTPFLRLNNQGVNSLGFTPGQFISFGANSVVPNGDGGTTGTATTTNTVTSALVSHSITFLPSPLSPNFFHRNIAFSSQLLGPWTLTFTNGSDSASAALGFPSGAALVPFVNSITLSGTSENPTFTWTPPPSTTVNGYRVNIYDKSLVERDPITGAITNTGQVSSVNLAPTVTSHTVTASDFTVPGYGFTLGTNYSIEILVLQTRDGSSTNLGNTNVFSLSRVYADFTPKEGGGPAVNLPVVLEGGEYKYDITVVPGETYYLDPEVAIGYDFEIGAGDPTFRSVVLPTGIGDDLYDIFGFNEASDPILLAEDWMGGVVYDFGVDGRSRFRILGIETSAGLDPASTTAFVTGVVFTGAGTFTGTQTPITVTVSVPEPGTLALLGLGLAGLAATRRRKQ
jgi:hypothetical protein